MRAALGWTVWTRINRPAPFALAVKLISDPCPAPGCFFGNPEPKRFGSGFWFFEDPGADGNGMVRVRTEIACKLHAPSRRATSKSLHRHERLLRGILDQNPEAKRAFCFPIPDFWALAHLQSVLKFGNDVLSIVYHPERLCTNFRGDPQNQVKFS